MKYASLLFVFAFSSCQIIMYDEPNPTPYWDDRDALVGSYRVDEYSETTDAYFNYDIDIVKSCCNDSEVLIRNFYDVGIEVSGYFDGYKLTIPRQYVGHYEVEGTGHLEGTDLNFSYVVHNAHQYPSTDFLTASAWLLGY